MRLFLTDIALERCRLNLAQIARAAGPTASNSDGWSRRCSVAEFAVPRLTPTSRAGQEAAPPGRGALEAAADLVKATGYHRRDGELADLRRELDGLAPLSGKLGSRLRGNDAAASDAPPAPSCA